MWDAFQANPEGVERCALLARAKASRSGTAPAGLLLTMIRAGEHLLEAKPDTAIPTGWRWVRGDSGAAGTYVEDPNGVDQLPPGYDFSTRQRLVFECRDPEEGLGEISEEIRGELYRLAGRDDEVEGFTTNRRSATR